ncbi:MAG: strawberry notch C-terminal domain-containing protein [Brasilonema octagenarum HA4186-MV1]|jgi:hypothetical protein|nr:strawberry notch C-terminal domain-containing protein [Brasilonema octagenarum HA4186-MV1]
MSEASEYPELIQAYAEYFGKGNSFENILEARKYASNFMNQDIPPGTALAKTVDEAIEIGIVTAGDEIVKTASSPQEAYAKLVDLHSRQPSLNVRSSSSMAQQAYSTPVPIAYLASVFAGIDSQKTVYEPAAGNGALVIGTQPYQVRLNELNSERVNALKSRGYGNVTRFDAANYVPEDKFDVVVANPPFGVVPDETGRIKQFQFGRLKTKQIDQAIALNALQAMKDDGTAVLILGGKLGTDESKRSDSYNTTQSRGFYWELYQNYNVTQHISIDGDLYKKQGAGFPIDVIVIEGKGQSALPLPAAQVPKIYRSFEELGELLNEHLLQKSQCLDAKQGRPNVGGIGSRTGDTIEREPVLGTSQVEGAVFDSQMGRRHNRNESARGDRAVTDDGSNSTGVHFLEKTQATDNSRGSAFLEEGMERHYDRQQLYTPGSDILPRSDISSGSDPRRNHQGGTVGDVAGGRHSAESRGMAAGDAGGSEAALNTPKQVPYIPRSKGRSVDTLVPINMQTSLAKALDELTQEIGSVDEYVTGKLGYNDVKELYQCFSAEQIDALALTVSNIERGGGFILADQTGIGKGRVVAGTIRYAKSSGKTPIFVTKDQTLYADMIRDLGDIGMKNFNAFVTHESLKELPLPDGRRLSTTPKTHRKELAQMRKSGSLLGYDAIFTTYTQMQTVKGGQETERREFLRQFADENSLVILDESHEAGGGKAEKITASGAANRAEFTRDLISRSGGVLYSSATYAKNPDVMDLYYKTDMRFAVDNVAKLSGMVSQGGIPLQQALATMLTGAGQYCRRERSFEGVKFEPALVSVNHDTAENISLVMKEIMEFDRHKQVSVEHLDKAAKAEAKTILGDGSTGNVGVSSTNFTSIMHNLVGQMLLGLKAEETVQKCVTLLRQEESEKPVVALSNTMGSFLEQYANENDLSPGDAIDANFGDLLLRYLERSRDVIIGSPYGEKKRHRLTDAELGEYGVSEYERVKQLILETDFSGVPVSPVDYIKSRLQEEGFKVGEVTGREHIGVYDSAGTMTYKRRSNAERSKSASVQTVKAFNSGELDVIILNRSGSTGISLHASEKFTDQRRRHMIVTQPDADINQFMQMLGRVHRTGQVVPPNFTLLMADIPAEKRPGAVLAKKMASLNANTTAARSGGIALDNVPDFMNEYGDNVVREIMTSHPEIHALLDYPLEGKEDFLKADGAVRSVTGRIPLLPLQMQSDVYDLIESEYNEFVAQKQAMGESILEAGNFDLDAKVLERMEVIPADSNSSSPFQSAVYLEKVDVKAPRKPCTTLEAINIVRGKLGLDSVSQVVEHERESIKRLATNKSQSDIETLREATDAYLSTQSEKRQGTIEAQYRLVENALTKFKIGQPVEVYDQGSGIHHGIVTDMTSSGIGKSNPVAPSSWKLHLLIADSSRELKVPLSTSETTIILKEYDVEGIDIYDLFDANQHNGRETRHIFTGNLLRAYDKFGGRVINYTDMRGGICQGIIMPRGYNGDVEIEQLPVPMPSNEAVKQYLAEFPGSQLSTPDKLLNLKQLGESCFLEAPKARAIGGEYTLDPDILAATGSDFYSSGDRMVCSFDVERLDEVLQVLVEKKNLKLAATDNREQARKFLGVEVPKFSPLSETESTITSAQKDVTSGSNTNTEYEAAEQPLAETVTDSTTGANSSENEEHNQPDVETVVKSNTTFSNDIPRIASYKEQQGTSEKNIAKLLERGGISELVLQGEDYHCKIENEPYIPLVIERHNNELYVTHYLDDNWGDLYIDSEMVFNIQKDGTLNLKETAVTFLGREHRGMDRNFAAVFSRNILHQGFDEALKRMDKPSLNVQSLRQGIDADVKGGVTGNNVQDAIAPSQTQKELAENLSDGVAEGEVSVEPTQPVTSQTAQVLYDEKIPPNDEAIGEARRQRGISPEEQIKSGEISSPQKQTKTEDTKSQNSSPSQPHKFVSLKGEQLSLSFEIAATTVPVPAKNFVQEKKSLLITALSEDLSTWAKASRDLNLPQKEIKRIQQLSVEAQKANSVSISPTDAQLMHETIEAYKPYQERAKQVLEAANLILGLVGTENEQGDRLFRGQNYEITKAKDDTLSVKRNSNHIKPEVILQAHGDDNIARTTVQAEDVVMFTTFLQRVLDSKQYSK